MPERVLSLDISTKTGWAVIVSSDVDYCLEAYGQIKQVEMPDSIYPVSYVDWAYTCFGHIVSLIDEHHPDFLVIEETSGGSKSAHSQKILEFIHFLVARLIKETGISSMYLMTEEWRRVVGCLMTKEESKKNKLRSKIKKETGAKLARDENGKIIGKITRKHVNVRRANEIFGQFLSTPLKKKDEDTADALLLAYCYHAKKIKVANEG